MRADIEVRNNARPVTFDVDAVNERGEVVPTPIAGEHPLTLYFDKREIVTLMTLGAAPEHLHAGTVAGRQPAQVRRSHAHCLSLSRH